MLATLIQIAVAALWGIVLASHICRLARLAYVAEVHATREPYLRRYAQRMWWLGREEFWRRVEFDTCRCLEITLLAFLLAVRM
jgi:hypothetical protein